jgi:hypothetical protein
MDAGVVIDAAIVAAITGWTAVVLLAIWYYRDYNRLVRGIVCRVDEIEDFKRISADYWGQLQKEKTLRAQDAAERDLERSLAASRRKRRVKK